MQRHASYYHSIVPPLVIDKEEIHQIVAAFQDVLKLTINHLYMT